METMGMGTAMQSKLATAKAGAVLRAEDLSRAKRFYQDTLGLKVEDMPSVPTAQAMIHAGDGSQIWIYERPGMAAPQNTTLGFVVPKAEFDQVADDLRQRGVKFEEYDIPEIGLKTTNGVASLPDGSKAAWFTDTEGNIINLASM